MTPITIVMVSIDTLHKHLTIPICASDVPNEECDYVEGQLPPRYPMPCTQSVAAMSNFIYGNTKGCPWSLVHESNIRLRNML